MTANRDSPTRPCQKILAVPGDRRSLSTTQSVASGPDLAPYFGGAPGTALSRRYPPCLMPNSADMPSPALVRAVVVRRRGQHDRSRGSTSASIAKSCRREAGRRSGSCVDPGLTDRRRGPAHVLVEYRLPPRCGNRECVPAHGTRSTSPSLGSRMRRLDSARLRAGMPENGIPSSPFSNSSQTMNTISVGFHDCDVVSAGVCRKHIILSF